ncbi:MAG TPA: N-acyl homoserine lactonase family protein [Solirubrobacteraceae bacterium]|jgi:glyoxylase-like metal-dependent hydrolase (beta-lactamase superfamily II)|nr:N-acyl homoserine lactonase family protein [Solirubrobacteraceae bacterium]
MAAAEAADAKGLSPTRYEILAIRYGSLTARKSELYYRHASYGEPDADVEMAYWFWALRDGSETILIDTGFAPAAGARRGRTCLREPLDALRDAGIEPADVSTVIVTHMHYDHIGNLAAFPQAQLTVPRRELEFWTSAIAARAQFAAHVEEAEVEAVAAAARDGRVRLLDGVEEIRAGISAHCVGGHSPGQQITLVETQTGTVVITSDAVHFYEELELDRPFGVIADLEEMYAAFDLLRGLAASGAVLVPGHDPQVAARFPALDSGAAALAVRVA